ncbi:MAG: hypothetical protein JXA82_01955 [Sedimentisphaerales bacterium]|nr:hypothetical protein [Sedimentisphaerales bacterium]
MRGPDGQKIDPGAWIDCLSNPNALLEGADEVLKVDGTTRVVSKKFAIGSHQFRVVLKRHITKSGPFGGFRFLFPSRAIQTFHLARRLLQVGLTTPWPLAAIEHSAILGSTESILITQHLVSACELYQFVQDHEKANNLDPAVRRSLCHQIAMIFADLDQCGLWHRDAKASNFLVQSKDDSIRLCLVDLDGIKPILPWDRDNRTRGLAKLAATLLWSSGIHTTDLLRIINDYARVTGLSRKEKIILFRSLSRRATAERIVTFIAAAEQVKERHNINNGKAFV